MTRNSFIKGSYTPVIQSTTNPTPTNNTNNINEQEPLVQDPPPPIITNGSLISNK